MYRHECPLVEKVFGNFLRGALESAERWHSGVEKNPELDKPSYDLVLSFCNGKIKLAEYVGRNRKRTQAILGFHKQNPALTSWTFEKHPAYQCDPDDFSDENKDEFARFDNQIETDPTQIENEVKYAPKLSTSLVKWQLRNEMVAQYGVTDPIDQLVKDIEFFLLRQPTAKQLAWIIRSRAYLWVYGKEIAEDKESVDEICRIAAACALSNNWRQRNIIRSIQQYLRSGREMPQWLQDHKAFFDRLEIQYNEQNPVEKAIPTVFKQFLKAI